MSCARVIKYQPPGFSDVIEKIKANNSYVESIELSSSLPYSLHLDIEMTEDANPEETLNIWEEISMYVQSKVFTDWLSETEFLGYKRLDTKGLYLSIVFNCKKGYIYTAYDYNDFTEWEFYKYSEPNVCYLILNPPDLTGLLDEIEKICSNVNAVKVISHKSDGFNSQIYDTVTLSLDYTDEISNEDIEKVKSLVGSYINSSSFLLWLESNDLLLLKYDLLENKQINFDLYLEINPELKFVSKYESGSFDNWKQKE